MAKPRVHWAVGGTVVAASAAIDIYMWVVFGLLGGLGFLVASSPVWVSGLFILKDAYPRGLRLPSRSRRRLDRYLSTARPHALRPSDMQLEQLSVEPAGSGYAVKMVFSGEKDGTRHTEERLLHLPRGASKYDAAVRLVEAARSMADSAHGDSPLIPPETRKILYEAQHLARDLDDVSKKQDAKE
ncbi:MAG: hypothetical protein ACLFOY_16575 [Desulfatibacillaceae bacterium]